MFFVLNTCYFECALCNLIMKMSEIERSSEFSHFIDQYDRMNPIGQNPQCILKRKVLAKGQSPGNPVKNLSGSASYYFQLARIPCNFWSFLRNLACI